MIEPIQGEGGFVVPAPGFLPALAAWATEQRHRAVADEIQTGFCRTGDWFASDHEGVVPDLVTTAKGIAGGLPLAAVTGRAELMDAVHGGGLGGTYGGNPVACAAALGAIEEMRAHDLAGRARAIGELMRGRLDALAAAHPVVGDVRGRGAMMAVELCRPGTTEPDPATHRRGVGVLPPARRGHPDLRHLGQRAAAAAAAGEPDELLEEALGRAGRGLRERASRAAAARLAPCSRPATASAPSGPATSTTSSPWRAWTRS